VAGPLSHGFELARGTGLRALASITSAHRARRASRGGAINASVVFSAHSLPKRILDDGDPYPSQLSETAEHVAAAAGIKSWRIGWQSAGRTDEPWLGPDLGDVISQLSADDATGVVVCPCGFVADHLEVLYDVDIEARRAAESAGLAFGRTAMPNDGAEFLDVAAAVVNRRFQEP
jgi:ferrochelatase